jgi:hypothetical protein
VRRRTVRVSFRVRVGRLRKMTVRDSVLSIVLRYLGPWKWCLTDAARRTSTAGGGGEGGNTVIHVQLVQWMSMMAAVATLFTVQVITNYGDIK